MKVLILSLVVICFHSLSQAQNLKASLVTKQNSELLMVSEFQNDPNAPGQMPLNSLKNLQIKGALTNGSRSVLVFDLVTADVAAETFVMTAQEKLVAAELDATSNAVKVEILENGDVMTTKGALAGKLKSPVHVLPTAALWNSQGQIVATTGEVLGEVAVDGQVLNLVSNLDQKITLLTGSGNEVVITGEKKEFLSSMAQLAVMNSDKNVNPEWFPVADLKISTLGSVLQIEFRNSLETESFSSFKLISPLIVNQIKEIALNP